MRASDEARMKQSLQFCHAFRLADCRRQDRGAECASVPGQGETRKAQAKAACSARTMPDSSATPPVNLVNMGLYSGTREE